MKSIKYHLYACLFIVCLASYDLAAQVKEVPITTSSKEALNFFLAGRDKLENMEVVAAASLFEKAIEKDPSFAIAYIYRAQSGGSYKIFSENLDKAVSLEDKVSPGEKLIISFLQAYANGNGEQQKGYLDQLLSTFPFDKRVQENAGEYYYSLNDYQTALAHFAKAKEIDKDFAPVYNMIGYCLSALNNYPAAEEAFQTYINLMPEKPNPYDSYAELLLKMGKYDESIVQYKKALEKDPLFITSLAGIGNNYVFKGDYTTARKYFQDYYDKAPTANGKLDALYDKATSFIHEGKPEEAVNTFNEFRSFAEKEKLVTNEIFSYAYQGFTVSEAGNPKEGKEYFDKAIDLIGKSDLPPAAKENLNVRSMLWRFYYLTVNNDLDKAQVQSEECKAKIESRKNPDEEMFFSSLLGIFELKKGDYDKAIKYFSQDNSQNPLTWYYTAQAYNKKGDKEDSEKFLDKIAKWNVNSLDLSFVRKNAIEEIKNEMSASKTR
jgi:tetratricopeptide (TPR) repeat protein